MIDVERGFVKLYTNVNTLRRAYRFVVRYIILKIELRLILITECGWCGRWGTIGLPINIAQPTLAVLVRGFGIKVFLFRLYLMLKRVHLANANSVIEI